jgi:hypothetical protein
MGGSDEARGANYRICLGWEREEVCEKYVMLV